MDTLGEVRETCDECGFDAADWPRERTTKELGTLVTGWQDAFARNDVDALHARPRPEVWSAVEYAVHTARVVEFWVQAARTVTAGDVVEIDMAGYPDADVFPYNDVGAEAALADLGAQLALARQFAETVSAEEWATPLRVALPQIEQALHAMGVNDAGTGVVHAVHDALHHLADIERGLATS